MTPRHSTLGRVCAWALVLGALALATAATPVVSAYEIARRPSGLPWRFALSMLAAILAAGAILNLRWS